MLPPVAAARADAGAGRCAASPIREARPALSPAAVRLSELAFRRCARPPRRKPRTGNSRAVVQLGAYSSRDRIAAAWNKVAGKYGALEALHAGQARFDSAKGTVYRLSVKGFASDREATTCALR